MPDPVPECCLCPGTPVYSSWPWLGAHLNGHHLGWYAETGRMQAIALCRNGYWFTCWCGKQCNGCSALGYHLMDQGGLAAHLLEISLGV